MKPVRNKTDNTDGLKQMEVRRRIFSNFRFKQSDIFIECA